MCLFRLIPILPFLLVHIDRKIIFAKWVIFCFSQCNELNGPKTGSRIYYTFGRTFLYNTYMCMNINKQTSLTLLTQKTTFSVSMGFIGLQIASCPNRTINIFEQLFLNGDIFLEFNLELLI